MLPRVSVNAGDLIFFLPEIMVTELEATARNIFS